ncbi:endolysin [Enterobacter phage 01_vB_Eclo_IJM]|nr:endolysin [Enterobacter phage 01_vB_Eclo_IJM]
MHTTVAERFKSHLNLSSLSWWCTMASKVQFRPRATTDAIFVHCSVTQPYQDIGVDTIRMWHKQQGWLDVGYHFVIKRDGTVEEGRPVDVEGHTLRTGTPVRRRLPCRWNRR